MPPNVTATDGPAKYVRHAGEALGVLFYCFIIGVAVLPESIWPVSYRSQVLAFLALVFLTTLLPPAFKLFGDIFRASRYLSSFLGEFPFHHWTLYYYPLLDRNVRDNWPRGIHYPTLVYRNNGTTTERLLLDSIIEPMNISGLVLHLIPRLLDTPESRRRQELVGFLVEFLQFKIDYYQVHGHYSISQRYLGPFSFPTANTQIEPPHDIERDDIKAINIYHVTWPEDMEDFNLRDIRWEGGTAEMTTKVASYAIGQWGTATETEFSPNTGTSAAR